MNARCYILHRKIPLCRETWGGLLLLRNSVQSSLLIPPGFAGRRENYWLCGTSKVSRIYILFKVETVIRQQCLIVSERLHDLWWVIFCWSGERQKSSCKSWRCTSAAELEGAAWEQLLVRLVQNGLFLIFVPYCQGSPLVLIGSWTVCMAAVNLCTVAELGCGLHLLHAKGLEVSAASPSRPVPSLRGPHCPPSWHTGSALGCWGQEPSERAMSPAPDKNLPPWKNRCWPLKLLPGKSWRVCYVIRRTGGLEILLQHGF